MKDLNIKDGRTKQKIKTRLEILNAARLLMQQEKKITLDDVAKAANISRATMYRYFSNLDLLITEATLDMQHKSPDQILEDVRDLSLKERLLHIQKQYNASAQKNETVFRRYLSAVLAESIVSDKPLRGARRMKSLNLALDPYKAALTKETFDKLIISASVLMGIDALIICKDVCKLDNKASSETLQWALEMMLQGILRDNEEIE